MCLSKGHFLDSQRPGSRRGQIAVLAAFLVVVEKPRREVSQFMSTVIMLGDSRWQDPRAAGHLASTVRKQ